jgi:hypothetical protein
MRRRRESSGRGDVRIRARGVNKPLEAWSMCGRPHIDSLAAMQHGFFCYALSGVGLLVHCAHIAGNVIGTCRE